MKVRRLLGGIFSGMCALLIAWLLGLAIFVADAGKENTALDTRADAVVVFTGGQGRIAEGLTLLLAGKAKQLFISGVPPTTPLAALLPNPANVPESVRACCIALGHSADNTEQNADETVRWLKENSRKTFILVTGHYHMRRALLELARLWPEEFIAPHKVFSDSVALHDWWQRPGTASLLLREYNKYLLALLRGTVLHLMESFKEAAPALIPAPVSAPVSAPASAPVTTLPPPSPTPTPHAAP